MRPDLDSWLERPSIRVHHRRVAGVEAPALWTAAQSVLLSDTRALGRLVRARIPRVPADASFSELLRSPPFTVLHENDGALVSGLVGRIWTLRRDYPVLAEADEFRHWHGRGTVRVMFAIWVEPAGSGTAAIVSETRVDAVDLAARLALTAVKPLITTSQNLIGNDGLASAVKRAERGG